MSTISWREQVAFDGMIMMSTLYQINTLRWICIVLAHLSNNPRGTVCSTSTHYTDSNATSFCFFSLILRS